MLNRAQLTRLAGQTAETRFVSEIFPVRNKMHTHGGGLDEEPPQNTADGKSKQLRGHDQHPLV